MVDEARVLHLLRSVTDDLGVLRSEAEADAHRRADALWLRGVKYTFVTAVEASLDGAHHLSARPRGGVRHTTTGTRCGCSARIAC